MRDGWAETALGSVLMLSNKKLGTHKEEPEIFAISKYDGVVLAQDYFDRRIASESLDGYKVIGPGDWVYSTIHIDEGSIAVNHFPFRGVVSPMYTSMIWNSHLHDYRFFEFLLKSDGALIRYQENAQGTVNRRRSLSWKAFSEMTFVVPPLVEQKRIVDVVSSVDAYIDALQQQAVTARTARNAVAEEAVNSGFPTFKLSQIGRIVTGSTPSTKRPEYWEPAEVDFITPGDFGAQLLILNASRRVSREGAKVSRALSSHSVLQVCIGATIGKVGYVSHSVVTNQQINSVAGLEELDAYFVSLMLSTNELQVTISDRAGKTTLPIISKSAWGELSIPWPDVQIRKGISLLAKSIDEYILATDNAVAKAKNLRSGLLSDLLSGEHEIPKAYDRFLRAA